MAEFRATLRVVKEYLDYCGFRAEEAGTDWDGHKIAEWCEHYLTHDVCPCGVETTVHHLMRRLEGDIGQPAHVVDCLWTRAASNELLVANGFKPLQEDN